MWVPQEHTYICLWDICTFDTFDLSNRYGYFRVFSYIYNTQVFAVRRQSKTANVE